MELTFENLLAHINTVYILVTKTERDNKKSSTTLTTWRHEEEGSGLHEANLRLKVIISPHVA